MMSKFTKYIKWGLSIIAAIFAVIEFLDFFKVYDFSGVGIKGLGIVVILAIIITISKAFLEKKNRPSDAQNRINEINGKITDRDSKIIEKLKSIGLYIIFITSHLTM